MCATSILLDDFLNGNVTEDQSSFFLGIFTLDGELKKLNSSYGTITTELDKVGTSGSATVMNNARNDLTQALTDVSSIPTGTPGQTMTLTYGSPLESAAPGGTIASMFPAILGD